MTVKCRLIGSHWMRSDWLVGCLLSWWLVTIGSLTINEAANVACCRTLTNCLRMAEYWIDRAYCHSEPTLVLLFVPSSVHLICFSVRLTATFQHCVRVTNCAMEILSCVLEIFFIGSRPSLDFLCIISPPFQDFGTLPRLAVNQLPQVEYARYKNLFH